MLENSRHKKIVFALLFLFFCLFGALFFAYVTSSVVAISHVEMNGDHFEVGDGMDATAHFTDWEQIASVEVMIDGQVAVTCKSAPTCNMSFVFLPEHVGDHTYEFVVTDKKGKKVFSGGKYTVVTGAPEITKLSTNNTVLPVGGALYLTVDAKSKSPVTSAKVYVDGGLKQYCIKLPCDAYVGPFTVDDAGQHIYSVVITNAKGKTVTPGGAFTVLPQNPAGGGKPSVSVPELVDFQISKSAPSIGETTTVTVSAKDEDGIASIIVFYDKKNVGNCADKNNCTVILGPFNNGEAGPHIVDVVIINKDGKKIEVSGTIVVTKKEQPASGAGNAGSNKQQPSGQPNGGTQPVSGNAGAANPQQQGGAQSPTNAQPTQGSGAPAATSTPKVQPPVSQPQNNAIPEASAPQLVYIVSQGNQLFVGDIASVNILVKDEKGIDSIVAYVDGKIVATCNKLVVCSFKKGPLTEDDLGSHTYSFLVKNIAGKTIEPGGGFTVSKPVSATIPSGPFTAVDENAFSPADQGIKITPKVISDVLPFPIDNTKKEPLWIDTDGGIKEDVVGQCVSNVKNARYQKSIQDYCVDKKQLMEFYVDEAADKCLSKQITCGGTCYEGRCYAAGSRPGAGYEPPSRPGAGYEPPPSRPGAGYEPPSRPGAGYEPPSRPGAGYEPPSRPGAGATPPTSVPSFETQIPVVKASYEDTDGGIVETVFGQCIFHSIFGLADKTTDDYCVDATVLMEYYVGDDIASCVPKKITCSGSCVNGACVAAKPLSANESRSPQGAFGSQIIQPTAYATDSDGGIVDYKFGQCHFHSIFGFSDSVKDDYCVDTKQLVEYYVGEDNMTCVPKSITCAGTCSLGKCGR